MSVPTPKLAPSRNVNLTAEESQVLLFYLRTTRQTIEKRIERIADAEEHRDVFERGSKRVALLDKVMSKITGVQAA